TGTVQFLDGGTPLGSPAPLAAVSGTFSATASLSTANLSVGTHHITAVYSNDGNYNGGTSPNFDQVVDTPPEVVSDAYSVLKDNVLTVGMPGLLGDDRDVDPGQSITTALPVVALPAHAANFAAYSDGSFTYTPLPGFIGVDSFTYQA